MVVQMMKWRPWPSLQQNKKFEAKIVVRCLTGLEMIDGHDDDEEKLMVEIKWKGSMANGFKSFRKKSVKRDFTRVEKLGQNGAVRWDEEFQRVCGLCGLKDKGEEEFHPWEIAFFVFNGVEKQTKKKVPLAAPAIVNLADFASVEDVGEVEINIPLSLRRKSYKCIPSLCITLNLMEVRAAQKLSEEVQRPIMFAPLSPCFGGSLPTKNAEGSTFKSSLRKVKSLTDYVSSRGTKKAYRGEGSSDSKFSTGSDDSESYYPFDTDSFDDSDEGESEESKDNDVQKSCSYGTLMDANLAGGALDLRVNHDDEHLVYYSNSNSKPDVESSPARDFGMEVSEQVLRQSPKFRILAWRKRKLSFKSPRVKGEPLLKKYYGEEGGDDIDFDRRQLSSDESMVQFEELNGSGTMVSEFGDDNFAVGSWEQKEVLSRDGSMKLRTQVFFASIDQRSEKAAGESACTALVAVIADWFHSNQGVMPIKSEFDSLIREGSLQWRNLCDNEAYRERFPDKHFDLETVLEAKIRPLSVVPKKSFIGFFHPEGLEEDCFGFLHGAMSFDNIWDEICHLASQQGLNSEPLVYIVSWNDHFFLLRVGSDAYYIIDTLGERLYEGCNQAYVLKFDRETTIERTPNHTSQKHEKTTDGKSTIVENSSSKEKPSNSKPRSENSESASTDTRSEILSPGVSRDGNEEEVVICKGKESCKEYIKSFLAAIPIRELQVDMKKGSSTSNLVHQRLQIEFNHAVQLLKPPSEHLSLVMVADETAPMATDGLASMAADVPVMMTDELTPMVTDVPVLLAADAVASTVADELATMKADLPVLAAA